MACSRRKEPDKLGPPERCEGALDNVRRGGVCMMTAAWSAEERELIGQADELQIAAKRADGTLWRPVPVWVVRVGEQVYVRTWHRRDNGWFGHVLDSQRARIQVPGLDADVTVEDVGEGGSELCTGVDAAYRAKYGRYGAAAVAGITTPDAAASTLRLSR